MFVHSLEWTRLPRGSVNRPHSREFRYDAAGAEMSSLVQHFAQNPTNLGSLPTVSARGKVGEPGQGHFMIVELMGSPSRIDAAAFQTYSCPNAIACGQFITSWIVGRPATDIDRMTADDLMKVLGGLPLGKEYCATLAVNALQQAIIGLTDMTEQ